MGRERKNLGDWGEEVACDFLRRQGFQIIERNFRTTFGEIDIVAKTGDDFYFVEVKTRRAAELATDLAITAEKKRRFAKAMRAFCYQRGIGEVGLVSAGLIVAPNRARGTVKFRLAVFT